MPKKPKPAVLRQCIAVTVNAHPTTEEHALHILYWLQKQYNKGRITGYFLIWEHRRTKNQHLHGGYILQNGVTISNARLEWVRLLSPFPEFLESVIRPGIRHWYNWDWCTNYAGALKYGKMQLPEQYEEIENTLPEEIPFCAPDDKQDVRPVNLWYDDREAEYLEFHETDPVNFPLPAYQVNVAKLLDYLMFDKKSIKVISDPRILTNERKALTKYINGGDPNCGSNCPFPREDPLVHSLESIDWWKKGRTFIDVVTEREKFPLAKT